MRIFKLFKESLKNKKTYLPNLLTFSRAFGAVVVPALFFTGNYIGVLMSLIIFSLTDFFDGRIARKTGGYSEFGALLDPIVDKIFAIGLTLAIIPFCPIVCINLIPEIIISYINTKAYKVKGQSKSSYLGKVKTWALFSTITLAYISCAFSLDVLKLLTAVSSLTTLSLQVNAMRGYKIKAEEEAFIKEEDKHIQEEGSIKELSRKEIINELKKERDALIGSYDKEDKPKVLYKRK